jgi:hypothetical protein
MISKHLRFTLDKIASDMASDSLKLSGTKHPGFAVPMSALRVK